MSWFAATPGGDRWALVLTGDRVADQFEVIVALRRTRRGLASELVLTPATTASRRAGADGPGLAHFEKFDGLLSGSAPAGTLGGFIGGFWSDSPG